ncbi:hypothetical protein [Halocatena halophila]|uniref:hypothetical protein n=1 Tax=Halocatena halophila TaxID=2814576 RepID=UPI002ED29EE7
MNAVASLEMGLNNAQKRLETASSLVTFVRQLHPTLLLQNADDTEFETRTYDATPLVRALFCRELAGLSWNGLYEYLSTDERAVRLGFDPAKFGTYNTAPTRQTLTTAWDVGLSDEIKRAILSLSERFVAAAYQNDAALDLRPPRHVDESESDLRGRHVGEFSNEQIRTHVRHARETVFGAFDSGRAANATYPDSRFDELQALMVLGGCGTPQGQSRMENFFGEDYTPPRRYPPPDDQELFTGADSSGLRAVDRESPRCRESPPDPPTTRHRCH